MFKIKKILITLIIILLLPNLILSEGIRVAQISEYEIQESLKSVILARPENKELAVKHKKQQERQMQRGREMMKAYKDSKDKKIMNFPVDTDDTMDAGRLYMEVSKLVDRELTIVVEKLYGDQYDLVLGKRGNIIYSKKPIMDLTSHMKTELTKSPLK